jgi:hemoglobin
MTGSLFDKYSGLPTLNTVVSDFYALATSNETLKPFFDGVTMERLYQHQAAFLAVLMGAPTNLYTGRTMKEAHAHLHITEKAFDTMVMCLEQALFGGGIDEADIATMLERVMQFKSQIVTP